MKLINGFEISKEIKDKIKHEIEYLPAGVRKPKLVVILVGDNQASVTYVRNKKNACEYVGMESEIIELCSATTQSELLFEIDKLNRDNKVDGILVQLPLPNHIDELSVIERIDPSKDVDGFHPDNVANLFLNKKSIVPCTPKAIMWLLDKTNCDLQGKEVVVVGRSNIVGKPVAMLALAKNATVTIAHSKTKNLKEVCKRADVLICAVGLPKFFNNEYVKNDAVVIDVGINRDDEGKLCGDVDFEDVKDIVKAITPVPKGVGPMTIAMLIKNTMEVYNSKEK